MTRSDFPNNRTLQQKDSVNITVAVAGAGAAGLMAALEALKGGCSVLLFDSNDKTGKKIYATGNGKCNITNSFMEMSCFNTDVSRVFSEFDNKALIRFFESNGVFLHERNGYYYPRTDQAASIVSLFDRELRRYKDRVEIRLKEKVKRIRGKNNSFTVITDNGSYHADRVILACGGKVNSLTGCDGSGYELAASFGHSIVKPVPSLVPLLCDSPYLKYAAGVRTAAKVSLYIDRKLSASDTGELQINEKQLSGIPIFQISGKAARAIDNGSKACVHIDFLPEFSNEDFSAEIKRRQRDDSLLYISDLFEGLVPKGVASMISAMNNIACEKKLANLQSKDDLSEKLLKELKDVSFNITGTASFDKAQVTKGGVPLEETGASMESVKCKGLYLVGELLDVDGICGGYNLTFAMCSGAAAGIKIAEGN